jgi:hypothetical protein
MGVEVDMKVSMEIWVEDEIGHGGVARLQDIEIDFIPTQVGKPMAHPNSVSGWTIYWPNGGTLMWSALGWGKEDVEGVE